MFLASTRVQATKGAAAGAAVITALPIFGAVGTTTAMGVVVGSLAGAAAGVVDVIRDSAR